LTHIARQGWSPYRHHPLNIILQTECLIPESISNNKNSINNDNYNYINKSNINIINNNYNNKIMLLSIFIMV